MLQRELPKIKHLKFGLKHFAVELREKMRFCLKIQHFFQESSQSLDYEADKQSLVVQLQSIRKSP